MHRKTETFLTIGELSALSTFTLPTGRRVPALSVKVLRDLERRGLFDTPHGIKLRGEKFPLVLWKRKPTLPGCPRLYTGIDLACARLAAWMRFDGLRWSDIVNALRGRWSARYVLAAGTVLTEPDKELTLSIGPSGFGAAFFRTAQVEAMIAEYGDVAVPTHRYPLAWLGLTGGSLPQLEIGKVRDVTLEAWRWRHVPAELAARENVRGGLGV